MMTALIVSAAFTLGAGVGAYLWNLAIKRRDEAAAQMVKGAIQELTSLRDRIVALKSGESP
jgi:hypothetical protein